MSFGQRSRRNRSEVQPELLPLLDVIFLVLAVFVIASMDLVERRGLEVELSPSQAATPSQEPGGVRVVLTREGQVYLDEEQVPLAEVGTRVASVLALRGAHQVWVAGDRGGALGGLIEVLDRLRQAGVEEVSLEARRP